MKMNRQNKLMFGLLIRERKDILFGKFSTTLTHDVKVNEWKKILDALNSQGIFNGKDYKYLRDVAWQNMKRATMADVYKNPEKIKWGQQSPQRKLYPVIVNIYDFKAKLNKRETLADGSKCILKELDKIIIDIIGKESPSEKQILDEPSSILPEDVTVLSSPSNLEEDHQQDVKFDNQQFFTTYFNRSSPTASKKVDSKRKGSRKSLAKDILYLKKKKLQLEIYNLQLDAINKEQDLGFGRSDLTYDI